MASQSPIEKAPTPLNGNSGRRLNVLKPINRFSWVPFVIVGLLLALLVAIALNYVTDIPKSLIVVFSIGLIPAFFIIQKPELGTYIMIFTVFTNLSDLSTEKGYPSFNKPLLGLTALGIVFNYLLGTTKQGRFPKLTKVEGALIAFFVVVIASSFVASDRATANLEITNLAKDLAIGACVLITLDTKQKLKTGLVILIIALTFASFLGIIKIFSGTDQTFWGLAQRSLFGQTSSSGELRYGGPIGEANIWAQVLVSALPLVVYRTTFANGTIKKIAYMIAGLIITVAMLITQSRGAIIGLLMIVPLVLLDLRIKGPTIVFAISLAAIVLFLLPAKYTERIRDLTFITSLNQQYGYTVDESVKGRREKMLTGLAMYADHPILGVGFGNYNTDYWSYATKLGFEADVTNTDSVSGERHPHNLYIEIMSETGTLGILTYLAFIGMLFVELFKEREKYLANNLDRDWVTWLTATALALLTFLAGGFFLHGIKWRFIWMLTSFALAILHISSREIATTIKSKSFLTMR